MACLLRVTSSLYLVSLAAFFTRNKTMNSYDEIIFFIVQLSVQHCTDEVKELRSHQKQFLGIESDKAFSKKLMTIRHMIYYRSRIGNIKVIAQKIIINKRIMEVIRFNVNFLS